jgi:hypothetical protein
MPPDIRIATALQELDAALLATPDDAEDFDDELADVPQMDRATYDALLGRRAMTPFGQLLGRVRQLLVPGLIDSYRDAHADDRERILALLRRYRFVQIALWSLIEDDAWRLQKAEPPAKKAIARQALRLAVLTDEVGFVEPGRILTGIWSDLEEACLDPRAIFLEAADLASPRALSHGRSARAVLTDFEPYDYGVPPGPP